MGRRHPARGAPAGGLGPPRAVAKAVRAAGTTTTLARDHVNVLVRAPCLRLSAVSQRTSVDVLRVNGVSV